MTCIDCDGKTKTIDTRCYEGVVYRKHRCTLCGREFDTLEQPIITSREELQRRECFRKAERERNRRRFHGERNTN